MHISSVLFVLIFFFFNNCLCKEVSSQCPSSSYECSTAKANVAYKQLFAISDIVSVDPVHKDVIFGHLPDLKYELLNTDTSGFANCVVKYFKYYSYKSENYLKCTTILYCPHFNLQGDYKMKGLLLSYPVDSIGKYSVNTEEYNLIVQFDYAPRSDTKDPSRNVKNFRIYGQPLGRLVYNFENFSVELTKVINEFSREVAQIIQDPVIEANCWTLIQQFLKYNSDLMN